MKLPTTPDEVIRQAFRQIEQADAQNMKRAVAQDYILLKAPNGTVYRVTVNNAGQLVTQAV